MKTWRYLLIAAVVSTAASALALGRWRWHGDTRALRATMRSACRPISPQTYDPREIDALPAPVKRYFNAALQAGQAMIAGVHLSQQGQFRQNEKNENWQPFQATQIVTMHPPGFEWDARIRMAPGIDIWVRDAYVVGAGSLRAAALGLVSVADMHDTPALARGELMRYLAEAAWYPTALLPSQGVRWECIDDTSARATLSDGATTVTLEFRFGTDGMISAVWAAARPRTATESAPWLCRLSGYAQCAGMRVPLEAEVAWELPNGPAPYFHGRMMRMDYEFVAR